MAKILVVEDLELHRDMLARRLERRGHQVLYAENGQVCLDVCRSDRPDVVLLDLSMPVMDGWTTVAIMKRDDALRDIPVIALTAHALLEDRQSALAAGCDACDTKPVELERLLKKIALFVPLMNMEGTHGGA